jgi:hypothetical protein
MLRGRREHILCASHVAGESTGESTSCVRGTSQEVNNRSTPHLSPLVNNCNPPHRSCEPSAASHVIPPSSLLPPHSHKDRERGLGVYLVSGDEGSKESSCHHHKLHPLLTNTSCVTKRRRGATTAKHHATAAQTKTRSKQS